MIIPKLLKITKDVALICVLMTFICTFSAFGEAKKKDTKPEPKPKKSLEDSLKKSIKYDGLFTLYQDTTNGKTVMIIKKEQINKEYIYFSYIVDGVAETGQIRGGFRDNKVFSIRKYFNKIDFVVENTNFYFDPKSALAKSAGANISPSLLASEKILYEDTAKGIYLVSADNIFLAEIFQQIKPALPPEMARKVFSLGTLSKDKTRFNAIKNYTENTDLIVEYVYDNPAPAVNAGGSVTDERFVSIKVQHTLIQVPDNNYQPRYDDPRVGYFTTSSNDMTSTSVTPYHDFIRRWNLEKKEPSVALSEPVKPIVWWIENTTPIEFRETIKAAALSWNEAFEAAGFKNAMQVNIQPDDADWDAGDIRYNVLRWTSSPDPQFGGYGPSFVNPRTGEILGADVMLEFIFVTNRLKQEKIFQTAAMPEYGEFNEKEPFACSLGEQLHLTSMFGMQALKMNNLSEDVKKQYLHESLYYLVLHELGHTLGLTHNMKASQMWKPSEINNKTLTSQKGLVGSVMDYPAANVALDKTKQGQFFTTKPGPYDMWAIQYGYSPAATDAKGEEIRLNTILKRSAEPELMYGNDADDMRNHGMGIDPRVMIGDMSGDAISYSEDRMKLSNKLIASLKDNFITDDQSYHELRNAYLIITGEYATAARVISRYIGGVYVDRAFAGQKGATKPFTPVSYTDQKRAMGILTQYVFAENAWEINGDLYNYLQVQRRGFGLYGKNEDPKLHDRVLMIQTYALQHLLHQNVLQRITDSKLYGNTYSLGEMMTDMTNGIFKSDLNKSVNTYRQNLQIEYVKRLAEILKKDKEYDHVSQSMALYQLQNINKMMAANTGVDVSTKAHREHVHFIIESALENN